MRLIDADALLDTLKFLANRDYNIKLKTSYSNAYKDCMGYIKCAPTVDSVKHGGWRYDEALELEWCSECGFGKRKGDKRWYSYCPNCGAKMNEVEE